MTCACGEKNFISCQMLTILVWVSNSTLTFPFCFMQLFRKSCLWICHHGNFCQICCPVLQLLVCSNMTMHLAMWIFSDMVFNFSNNSMIISCPPILLFCDISNLMLVSCWIYLSWLIFFFVFMHIYEDSSSASATQAEKEEVDSRSIYVGNVRPNDPFFVSIHMDNFPI